MKYTYRQVFTKLLPEPYRSQAISNTIAQYTCADAPEAFGNGDPDDLESALLGAFTWSETPEGQAYWGAASRGQFPASRYRILEVGETIQEGDEVEGSNGWQPVSDYPVRCCIPNSFRRRVSASESSSPNSESRIADLESRVAALEGLVAPPPSAVDPGEGYRLLDIGETIQFGDEEADDESGGGWSPVHRGGDEFSLTNWYPVRRKIAPPTTYRLLNPGEIIREGDELLDDVNINGPEKWHKVTTSRWQAFDPKDHFVTRRPIKSFEDA